jgi:hypothetical protein
MAVLGSVAIAFAFLFPYAPPPDTPLTQAVGAALHVLLFASLAFLWGRTLPRWASGGLLWGGLASVAFLLECFQPVVGRSFEWSDWLFGIGGTACICGTASFARKAALRWSLVCVLAVLPLAGSMGLRAMESQAFPVLASPEMSWSRTGWIRNGVVIKPETETTFRIEARSAEDAGAIPYPGIFREPVNPDWRMAQSFHTRLFWPSPSNALFAVRVDDLPHNPPYAERFQREFAVTQGWNRIDIPAAEFACTSGGRRMEIEKITRWGVFLVAGPPLDYFLLGAVRLELQQEEP